MPFYRFLIEGVDPRKRGRRGFFTTRHAYGRDRAAAEAKVLKRLRDEFTSGASAGIWQSDAPELTVDEWWQIGLHQLFSAPNRGSTFYDDE